MAIQTEVLFITDEYIKKFTNVNGAVDSNIIRPAIYLAQDKYITNWLGTELINKLKTDITTNNLTGDYEVLLDQYVRKSTLWWTMVELYPHLLWKHDNGNLVSRQTPDTTAVTQNEMESLRDAARANAVWYTQRMVDYLCQYSSLFPEFNNSQFPNISPAYSVDSNTHVIFSSGYKQRELPWAVRKLMDNPNALM